MAVFAQDEPDESRAILGVAQSLRRQTTPPGTRASIGWGSAGAPRRRPGGRSRIAPPVPATAAPRRTAMAPRVGRSDSVSIDAAGTASIGRINSLTAQRILITAAGVPLAALGHRRLWAAATRRGRRRPQAAARDRRARVRRQPRQVARRLERAHPVPVQEGRRRQHPSLDACAAAWPPLRVHGRLAGPGLSAAKLTTTARSDGAPQVCYNGHPLYRYTGDAKPGDTNGQRVTAFGAAWFAVSGAGQVISRPASKPETGASTDRSCRRARTARHDRPRPRRGGPAPLDPRRRASPLEVRRDA